MIEQIVTEGKKKTAPGGGTPEAVRRNKTRLKLMFQSPLDIISHRVWLCHTHFPERTGDIMRNPNGYGTVAKLSGNRRRPFIVKK